MRNRTTDLPLLNGYSVSSLELDQEGNLTVTFDLPVKQQSTHFETSLSARRTLDVYECPEVEKLVKDLFRAVRRRLLKDPDADMARVDCSRCRDSNCCRNYNVLITEEDIERLRGPLSRAAFLRAYAVPAVDWSGDYAYQLRCDSDETGEKCVFLRKDGNGQMRCSVYANRPRICKDFDMATCTDFTPLDGE